jgi:hypothetical protein
MVVVRFRAAEAFAPDLTCANGLLAIERKAAEHRHTHNASEYIVPDKSATPWVLRNKQWLRLSFGCHIRGCNGSTK